MYIAIVVTTIPSRKCLVYCCEYYYLHKASLKVCCELAEVNSVLNTQCHVYTNT